MLLAYASLDQARFDAIFARNQGQTLSLLSIINWIALSYSTKQTLGGCMIKNRASYLSLALWILLFLFVGGVMGSFTKPEITGWYSQLQRSALTPADAVFPMAWTLLYILIAIAGWRIWQAAPFSGLPEIKTLYLTQLLLNWSWSPLFFSYHAIGLALLVLITLNLVVAMLIYKTRVNLNAVALLLSPYMLWIVFAAYLNAYIWWFN